MASNLQGHDPTLLAWIKVNQGFDSDNVFKKDIEVGITTSSIDTNKANFAHTA